MYKIFTLFVAIIMPISALFSAPSTTIIQIQSMAEITKQHEDTIYFFDLDDTLFDSPYMLGSKAWRQYIIAATKNDTTKNWHDLFSLFIARYHPLETIEPLISRLIQNLQSKGYEVFGLTARERKIWYETPTSDADRLTIDQLNALDICFNQTSTYSYLTADPEFYQGVFFANIEPKGGYIQKLFKNASQLPKKIIFVDDKQSQIESVDAALTQLGINHICYWYTATDEKAKKFDPLIANIQLYYFWLSEGKRIISDEEAATIAKQHPERDAEYYLKTVLNNAKKRQYAGKSVLPTFWSPSDKSPIS